MMKVSCASRYYDGKDIVLVTDEKTKRQMYLIKTNNIKKSTSGNMVVDIPDEPNHNKIDDLLTNIAAKSGGSVAQSKKPRFLKKIWIDGKHDVIATMVTTPGRTVLTMYGKFVVKILSRNYAFITCNGNKYDVLFLSR